ncbi:methyl-accepting chemotaxis protein [Roseicella sp. GB24]|uniref:Methyl-accepting chemotaxis protein n=2 Tax=Roseicella aerolata TaxID=2883479 RepID=A0A9X1IKZ9_9PROT|nr:methyl-accepting chemotaxis protein [Roseicella aerolata]
MRLAEIRDLSRDTILQVSLMPAEIEAGIPVSQRIAAIRSEQARIGEAWSALTARLRREEERSLAQRLAEARQRFWQEGLEPALAIAERRDGPALRTHLQERMLPLFAPANQLNLALAELHASRTAEAYAGSQADYGQRLWLVPAAGLGGLLLLGGLGLLGFAGQRSHLRQLETELVKIARGELKGHIHTPPAREFRPVVALLRAMRARIAYAEQERAELDRRAGQERTAAVREMADKVEDATRTAVDEVAQRTEAMAAQAAEVAGMAERLGGNAAAAAESAGRALDNTQAVAAATEQLSASIREIAGQTAHATAVVARAVEGGRAAESTIATLAQAAGQVHEVVRLIGDVAERTNLLALNATIEAARAGEAGKGFAVVASEVKQLAAQTARATEDISRQLSGIQSATEAAVRAVSGMGQAIDEISGTAGAIAAAVEQQGAATQEIARNVAGNGEEVRAMAGRIEAVASDAAAAGIRAVRMRDGSGEVDRGVRGMRQDLLQMVRTSMAEADRRMEPRYPVSEPCLIEANGQRLEGSLVNISAHGALAGGIAALPAGTRGTLHLPRRKVQIACEVREAGLRGLHLRFDEQAITDAYRRAFEALTETAYPQPRDRAA